MGFPLDLIWLAVPAYIIIQAVVIGRSSGSSRWIAVFPLVVMVPIFVLTGIAYAQDSNLWPLWLLWASPVALLYVVIVAFFVWPTAKEPSRHEVDVPAHGAS